MHISDNQSGWPDHSNRIIEFVGLPGAGKTTTADAVARQLRERGYRVSLAFPADHFRSPSGTAQWCKWLHRLWHVFVKPGQWRFGVTATSLAAGIRPWNRRRRISTYGAILSYAAAHRAARSDDRTLVLWEEGIIHRLAQITTEGRLCDAPDYIPQLASCLAQLSDWGVVVLYLPEDVAANRISTRPKGTSRFDHWERHVVLENLRSMNSLIYPLSSRLMALGVPGLIVDSRLEESATASLITDWISSREQVYSRWRDPPTQVAPLLCRPNAGI